MPDHEEQITPSEGPSPTEEDDDPGQALEDYISGMDRPLGADDAVTADEQHSGDTIDRFNRREQPTVPRPDTSVDLVDDGDGDGVDDVAEMVGDAGDPGLGPEAPEQAAVHIVDQAPGGVDHPDDYVDD
jgi:hypothetical protein